MTMNPRLRKFALTAHVIFSVGWLGAAAAYLTLAIAALTSRDTQMVRAAYLAMEPAGWFAIVPLALAALLTGLIMSLGTLWGLFRHYWVLFKLLLTLIATIVLLGHMPAVSVLAGIAADTGSVNPGGLRSEILHSGGGLLVLITVAVLGIYKPRGRTSYGRRKQFEQRNAGSEEESGSSSTTATPRWVKVFGIIILILLLLLIGMMFFGGGHGPGGHIPPVGGH